MLAGSGRVQLRAAALCPLKSRTAQPAATAGMLAAAAAIVAIVCIGLVFPPFLEHVTCAGEGWLHGLRFALLGLAL